MNWTLYFFVMPFLFTLPALFAPKVNEDRIKFPAASKTTRIIFAFLNVVFFLSITFLFIINSMETVFILSYNFYLIIAFIVSTSILISRLKTKKNGWMLFPIVSNSIIILGIALITLFAHVEKSASYIDSSRAPITLEDYDSTPIVDNVFNLEAKGYLSAFDLNGEKFYIESITTQYSSNPGESYLITFKCIDVFTRYSSDYCYTQVIEVTHIIQKAENS